MREATSVIEVAKRKKHLARDTTERRPQHHALVDTGVAMLSAAHMRSLHVVSRQRAPPHCPRGQRHDEELGVFAKNMRQVVVFNSEPRTMTEPVKKRFYFSYEQEQLFRSYYGNDKTPSKEQRELLASKAQCTFKQVDLWFKNRRPGASPGAS